jgi:uncharacterized protein involved in propanediol utilization
VTSALANDAKIGRGKAFGTFGELLQGTLNGNSEHFLFTFPIQIYSNATFYPDATTVLNVVPYYKKKSREMADMLLKHYRLPNGGTLHIDSEIPVGKGLASSSADLVATARAVGNCYGLTISDSLIQGFMCEIEPSDGVLYPGVCSFNHKRGIMYEFFGPLTNLTIVAIDEGGEVDTVEFNKIPKPFSDSECLIYEELLNVMSHALKVRDLNLVGKISTISGLLNQKLKPKKTLNRVISLCHEAGALGVLVAHSGTFIGILMSKEQNNYTELFQTVCNGMNVIQDEIFIFASWSPEEDLCMVNDLSKRGKD